AIVRYVPGELGADALGADRCGVGSQGRLILRRPFLADFWRVLDPGFAFAGTGTVGRCKHAGECDLGIAVDAGEERIIAASRLRIDANLDRRRADLRHRPEMRGHAAGLGADEAHEIGAIDHAVGALARIGADDADRKWMVPRYRVLAVERGRDRDLQRLRER